MYYILTTYFQDHWNKVKNNRTSYITKYLKIDRNKLINDTQTIFLRINKDTNVVEKAWLGKVYNIEEIGDKTYYSIKIDNEIELEPDIIRTKIGWYVIDTILQYVPPQKYKIEEDKKFIYNKQILTGKWDSGWSLDLHTHHSIALPDGQFDTTRTPIGELLYKLKYQNNKECIDKIIAFANEFFKDADFSKILNEIDIIIPVPPSTKRVFQPVYELANKIGAHVNKKVDLNYLIKIKETSSIKNEDDPVKRSEILKDVFTVKDNRYEGKSVLLFDDLFRSGATLNEITNTLMNIGKIKKAFVFTITKTRTKR